MKKGEFLHSVLVGGLLALLCWTTIEASLLLRDSRQALQSTQPTITKTLTNIELASKALQESSVAVKEVSQAQQKLLTDKKTQDGIALLLRQGNDLARTVDKVNTILDKVNRETLPRVNLTLDATESTITSTKQVIVKLGNQGEVILSESDKVVNQLFTLLADPNVQKALEGIANTTEASSKAALHVELTARDIQQAIPELVASVKAVANNADLSSQEVTKFLTGLNKPLTRKQKIFRFLLEAIVKSSPVLLRK